uniref:Biogenesis of lysosome-related organelles complex 1 subunit 7 n=1 Tax=Steinernema glaseri TaxID=37863 RepID=A0A1I7YI58_9BILA
MASESSSSEQVGGGNELTEGIMNVIGPAIHRLDEQVHNTRTSQVSLALQIDELSQYLKAINDEQSDVHYDLDVYVSKLDDSRRRVSNVSQTLLGIQERLSQLQRGIARESYAQKQNITTNTTDSSSL